MEIIVQWATILSPIIAVLLAWWMSKGSERQTAKQIESIKELEKIQINLLQLQIDKELFEAKIKLDQVSCKANKNSVINNQFGGLLSQFSQMEDRKQDINNERDYHTERLRWMQYLQHHLDEMKKQIIKS